MTKSAVQVIEGIRTASEAPKSLQGTKLREWARYLDFVTDDADPKVALQLETMLFEAASFIRAVKNGGEPRWLSFLGTSGAGKSYLARKIFKWFKNSPLYVADVADKEVVYPGTFVAWDARLAPQLQGNTGYEQIKEFATEKLVVLDEIGSKRDMSGHVKDCLCQLLSARVGKWTVITANLSLADIGRQIDPRISSRMIRNGGVVLDVDMPDFARRHPAPIKPIFPLPDPVRESEKKTSVRTLAAAMRQAIEDESNPQPKETTCP